MSCGLACIAYLTSTPYDVLAKGQPSSKLYQSGFWRPELVEILRKLGYDYAWKRLAGAERDAEFEIGEIVFIEPSASHRFGHYLVKSPKGWMDPWINLDYSRLNLAEAESGFRDKLPGRASYLIYKVINNTGVGS